MEEFLSYSASTAPISCSLHTQVRDQLLIIIIGIHAYYYISKTSRFYIGLAVGLPVFSNISIILTHVQTVLSLQGKATSRKWLNR